MADTTTDNEIKIGTPETGAVETTATPAAEGDRGARRERRGRGGDKRGGRNTGNRARPERKSEFDTRMINIRRVARVMAGGRRFSFTWPKWRSKNAPPQLPRFQPTT
jgi:hypothetical protein